MKHLFLITSLALAACSFAMSPKTASAATEFTPYLDLRASLGYTYTKEKEGETNYFGKGIKGTSSGFDNTNFFLGSSNVGAKFKADKVTGEAQIFASDGLDKYWMEYDAGFAKFMIGKLNPMYTLWTNQAAFGWDGLCGYGVAWMGREKQIKVTVGGFYIDLMPANVNDGNVDSAYVQTLFPKTNIGYNYAFGDSSVNFGLVGNYNKFAKKDGKLIKSPYSELNADGTISTTPEADMSALDGEALISYMAYVNATIITGKISILATADYGVNEGNMGLGDYNFNSGYLSAVLASNGKYKDTTSYEGALELMYKVDPWSIGGGIGYVHSENKADGAKMESALMSCYLEAIIPVNEFVTIYPEVSYFKTLKDPSLQGNKAGEEAIWAGALINYYM